jgi:hypothetical protein
MRRVLLAGMVLLTTFVGGAFTAVGAELDARGIAPKAPVARFVKSEFVSSCRSVWACGPFGCEWQKICPRRCPDRYSCYSLYGAYGPYGGTAYWGRYTSSGWGTYR